MKTLKIYGTWNKLFIFPAQGYVADIIQSPAGIRITAKDAKLKDALGKLVTQLWKEDRLCVSRAINEQIQGKRVVHHIREPATLDHPLFIEALWEVVRNWEDSVIAGHKIIWSRSKIR